MSFRFSYIISISILALSLSGQSDTLPVLVPVVDTTIQLSENLDSIPPIASDEPVGEMVKIADNDLDKELVYGAIDSSLYNHEENLMYLYGSAYVNYGDKKLKADLIILDMENKIAEATISDLKRNPTPPTFSDGGKTYQYKGLKYNFETEKGIVYDAVTNEGEFLVHGAKTKYVSAGSDRYSDGDVIYNANSLITTCKHEHPHFGFRAKKLKVIPDKVIVSGPANLEIAGVPTPLWLPFGFYPLTQGASTGLIFPQGYQFHSKELGFGLSGFGWYFPFNDNIHTSVTGTIYTKGSWGLNASTNYAKKYKYRGSVNLSYDNFKTEQITEQGFQKIPNPGYNIFLRHTQDSKAHPFITIGGDIKIDGRNNRSRVFNDVESVLTNTYRSSFKLTHNMPKTPFTFSLGFTHDQNTNTHKMNITLPDVDLVMKTIYPFERKNQGGNKKKWYEKTAFSHSAKLKNFTTTTDSTLFSQETLDNMRSGLQQKAKLSLSNNVLKYFNLTQTINYSETWVLHTIDKQLEQVSEVIDSVETFRDSIYDEVKLSPDAYRNMSANMRLSTQLFALKTFKRGPIRGIRLMTKPSIGYAITPDQSQLVDTLVYFDGSERQLAFSRFDRGPFGNPRVDRLSSRLTYGSSSNVLELKYFNRKDSTEKKIKLLDRTTWGGDYDFAKDTLNWSRLSVTTGTTLLKGISQLNTGWSFDPYIKRNGKRLNETVYANRGKLVRLESGNISISTSLTFKKIKSLLGLNSSGSSQSNRSKPDDDFSFSGLPDGMEAGLNQPLDLEQDAHLMPFSSLLESLTLSHEFRYNFFTDTEGQVDTEIRTNSITLRGTLPLTENWSVRLGSFSYNLVDKRLGYSAITFDRKLHCWNMSFSWFPTRDTYSFFIGVSSSAISFLEYNYGQNNTDGFFGRF